MTAVFVESDVKLVDLDLAYAPDRGAQVVLQAVGSKAKERVDQPVVADDRKKRLLIVERIRPDQLGRRVGDRDSD